MLKRIGPVLGVLALAAPAMAQDTGRGSSTYVPGSAGTEGSAVAPYSTRNDAVQGTSTAPNARGGGPSSAGMEDAGVRASGRYHGETMSDNQTRRPGAANYTGAAFERGAVRDPSSPNVEMQGDAFDHRTGAVTRGPMRERAPASNESRTREPVPSARGGGPEQREPSVRPVRTPHQGPVGSVHGRTHERVVRPGEPVTSGPLTPFPSQAMLEPRSGAVMLTQEDLRHLPDPRTEDMEPRAPGLLVEVEPVHGNDLIDSAEMVGAAPVQLRMGTGFPATTRAIGGGPGSGSVTVSNRELLQADAVERAEWQNYMRELASGWPDARTTRSRR